MSIRRQTLWKPNTLTCNRCNGLHQTSKPTTKSRTPPAPFAPSPLQSPHPPYRGVGSPPQPPRLRLRARSSPTRQEKKPTTQHSAKKRQPTTYRTVPAHTPTNPTSSSSSRSCPVAISIRQGRSRAGEASESHDRRAKAKGGGAQGGAEETRPLG